MSSTLERVALWCVNDGFGRKAAILPHPAEIADLMMLDPEIGGAAVTVSRSVSGMVAEQTIANTWSGNVSATRPYHSRAGELRTVYPDACNYINQWR